MNPTWPTHVVCMQEAKTLGAKEEVEMQLDFSNQAKRVLEAEALNKAADLAEVSGGKQGRTSGPISSCILLSPFHSFSGGQSRMQELMGAEALN